MLFPSFRCPPIFSLTCSEIQISLRSLTSGQSLLHHIASVFLLHFLHSILFNYLSSQSSLITAFLYPFYSFSSARPRGPDFKLWYEHSKPQNVEDSENTRNPLSTNLIGCLQTILLASYTTLFSRTLPMSKACSSTPSTLKRRRKSMHG